MFHFVGETIHKIHENWYTTYINEFTVVNPVHEITASIKQSPVLKCHISFVGGRVIENFIWIEPLIRAHIVLIGHFFFVS